MTITEEGVTLVAAKKKGPTTPVRIYDAEADMLYWISRATGRDQADIITPMIRSDLSALYERHREKIERLRKAEAEVKRIEEEIKQIEPPPVPKRPGRGR